MTRIRVKICGIERAQGLRAALLAGADAPGFVVAPKSTRPLMPAGGPSAGNLRAAVEPVRP